MTMRNYIKALLILFGLLLISTGTWWISRRNTPQSPFDGERAYKDVVVQVSFGPRTLNSQAHTQAVEYIQAELRKANWQPQIQQTTWQGFPVENILATRNNQTPQIILGVHYDSRMVADQDPGPGPHPPVPGANDGASGVAVLLELARTLPPTTVPISLVFFDAEDDGGLG